MACYAALLSLFHTLNNIKIHPRPPISLDQKQLHSLNQNLTFLLHFLECRNSNEEDGDLESRIAAAAYAAEDVIESYIVDQIHGGSNTRAVDLYRSLRRGMYLNEKEAMKIMEAQLMEPIHAGLYPGLERVIGDMDLIKKEVVKIMVIQHDHLETESPVSTPSVGPDSAGQSSCTTAGFDDHLVNMVLDKLTGQQRGLQIIPIVGMGGIGKTTFAISIYTKPLIQQYFDIRAWVTISQEYSRRDILRVLCQETKASNVDLMRKMSEDELGESVYKKLWGRRYLIVMDDMWSIEAYDIVRCFFPDNNNGSRIMITTRMSNLAFELSSAHVIQMQFLDVDKCWDLLCEIVFGKLNCPNELEKIGKKIARKCRGLPLSIVVIGGLLKKSEGTRARWVYTLQNLNSLINLEDDEYCLQILRTSYKELPIHLKPCFLYIGVFPEDFEINVSVLIKLWVSEGILKPNDEKSLEEVAEEYLKELIERNLILVHKLRWNGEAKICKIHDLLRDVCSRESERQKFFWVVRQQKHHTSQGVNIERRAYIDFENAKGEYSPELFHVVESASLTRTLLYKIPVHWEDLPSLRLGLLRVYSPIHKDRRIYTSKNAILEHANLRYVSLNLKFSLVPRSLPLCSLHWNVQTLKLDSPYSSERMIASEIWEMPLLRHVMLTEFVLPDPPVGEDNFVLENLQTLSCVQNLKFSEEVVKRIPNVKKLKVIYRRVDEEQGLPNFFLNNLGRLQKLESFNLDGVLLHNFVCFPRSLKKLTLINTGLIWEELTIRIGSLPLLQVLRLQMNACRGPRWETVEEQFCSLRFLQISHCDDLKCWDTDRAHFPFLEHILFQNLPKLEEIPSSIGDIPTLKSIWLDCCCKSAEDSSRIIIEEQQENGNEDLHIVIETSDKRELYGAANAEIDEVILDMQRFKHDDRVSRYLSRQNLKIHNRIRELYNCK